MDCICQPRSPIGNEVGVHCYLGSLLQALLPCAAVRNFLQEHHAADQADCCWCLMRQTERDGATGSQTALSVLHFEKFFEALSVGSDGCPWGFRSRQHDPTEALFKMFSHSCSETPDVQELLRQTFGFLLCTCMMS